MKRFLALCVIILAALAVPAMASDCSYPAELCGVQLGPVTPTEPFRVVLTRADFAPWSMPPAVFNGWLGTEGNYTAMGGGRLTVWYDGLYTQTGALRVPILEAVSYQWRAEMGAYAVTEFGSGGRERVDAWVFTAGGSYRRVQGCLAPEFGPGQTVAMVWVPECVLMVEEDAPDFQDFGGSGDAAVR